MNKPKTKIFLVDDHPLVREWLTNLIHQQPDLVVCGESEDAPHALQEIFATKGGTNDFRTDRAESNRRRGGFRRRFAATGFARG